MDLSIPLIRIIITTPLRSPRDRHVAEVLSDLVAFDASDHSVHVAPILSVSSSHQDVTVVPYIYSLSIYKYLNISYSSWQTEDPRIPQLISP